MSVQPVAPPSAKFLATEAAFGGLGVLRRRPAALAVWAVLLLLFGLLSGVAMVATVGPQLTAVRSMGMTADPAARATMFGALLPFYAVFLVVLLIFYCICYAAVNRSMLRPETGGPGWLAAGGDELRQAACLILTGLVLLGVYIGGLIVVSLIMGLAVAALSTGGILVGVAAGLALLGLLIWLAVRLSLASPLTFDTRRVRLFGSFALTRGRFWKLFGAYLLSVLVVLGLYLLLVIVLGAVGRCWAASAAWRPYSSRT